MTRVLLADRHDEVLRALASFLREEDGVTVVGLVKETSSLLQTARKTQAEFVLVEFGLLGGPPEDLITALHGLAPRPRVVAMSAQSQDSLAALRAGAEGFISMTEDGDWLLASVRKVLSKPEESPSSN